MDRPSTHCGRRRQAGNRREFLATSASGFGGLVLGHLLGPDRIEAAEPAGDSNPLAPRPGHFEARAKHVILLFMQGGPSHVDTFDPKPELKRLDGQPIPASFNAESLSLQFMKATDGRLMASPFAFKRCGQSGIEVAEVFPHLGRFADDLAVIRSCYHDSFIHGPALTLMNSGAILLGHPSVGSWVVYGLGSESDNLPAYVVMSDGIFRNGSASYSSGFLPAVYQGTVLRTEGAPLQNLAPPATMSPGDQRILLDHVRGWNEEHRRTRPGDSRLDARIANYELAFRMQAAAPDLIDLSRESRATLDSYGVGGEPTDKFARMCLLSRRLVERGVRFVHLNCNDWDGHGECAASVRSNASRIDKPIAALLGDLKSRGLLESTLVVWTGEFGRTPVMQGNKGRDHSPYGFTSWMAGGGYPGRQGHRLDG